MVYSEEYMDFFDDFYEALNHTFEPGSERLKIIDVERNNITNTGIFVRPDRSDVGVTVYPEPFFQQQKEGIPLSDIVSALKEEILAMLPKISLPDLKEIASDKGNLRTSIVSYEANREWLKDIPHERIADLALFTRVDLGEDRSVKVNQRLLAEMQLTKEEAFKIAKANMADQHVLQPMSQVIAEIIKEMGGTEEMVQQTMENVENESLWVLRTEDKINGAGLMADPAIMRKVQEKFPEGFYILPSSIHEVLIVPKQGSDGMDLEELKNMVAAINCQEVPIEDRLSDNVYEFDGHSIKMAGQTETIDREMPVLQVGIHHKR